MTKPIEDSANAAAIRAALDVPTNAALTAKYTKPTNGIPATDLDADPAGRVLLTATSAAERKQVLGLDQVNNTSDANKPVSTAQAEALATKMNATMPALQSVFDGGTAAQKATFQSSVSWAGSVTIDATRVSQTLTDAEQQAQLLVFAGALAADVTFDIGALRRRRAVDTQTTGVGRLLLKFGAAGSAFAVPQNEMVEVQ